MKARMAAIVAVAIALWVSFSVPSATAAFCRVDRGREICILSIKRSAKNYREYRAAVSIDGIEQPIEVYDCGQKIRVTRRKEIVPFSKDPAGELICKFLEKTSSDSRPNAGNR